MKIALAMAGVLLGGLLAVADTPLDALYQLHAEALGSDRVRLLEDVIVFATNADQLMCAGRWKVTACGRNGGEHTVVITIVPPRRRGGDRIKKVGAVLFGRGVNADTLPIQS
jgi:hypothetical protein